MLVEFDEDREIHVNVRKLSNAMMLQIMARENMEEWRHNIAVEHQTVRAVVKAYANDEFELSSDKERERLKKLFVKILI